MKISPLHWRACPQPDGPTPKATPSAPSERGLSREPGYGNDPPKLTRHPPEGAKKSVSETAAA